MRIRSLIAEVTKEPGLRFSITMRFRQEVLSQPLKWNDRIFPIWQVRQGCSLPLDRRGWLAAYIIHNSVHACHFVDDDNCQDNNEVKCEGEKAAHHVLRMLVLVPLLGRTVKNHHEPIQHIAPNNSPICIGGQEKAPKHSA